MGACGCKLAANLMKLSRARLPPTHIRLSGKWCPSLLDCSSNSSTCVGWICPCCWGPSSSGLCSSLTSLLNPCIACSMAAMHLLDLLINRLKCTRGCRHRLLYLVQHLLQGEHTAGAGWAPEMLLLCQAGCRWLGFASVALLLEALILPAEFWPFLQHLPCRRPLARLESLLLRHLRLETMAHAAAQLCRPSAAGTHMDTTSQLLPLRHPSLNPWLPTSTTLICHV